MFFYVLCVVVVIGYCVVFVVLRRHWGKGEYGEYIFHLHLRFNQFLHVFTPHGIFHISFEEKITNSYYHLKLFEGGNSYEYCVSLFDDQR